ncbi:MAG: ABC-F family ATP-binding cassette domain-containing protein, partial [Bacteroidales bacterium]|nr:ABC-F family ATP-binding cassette domain-containing protein [Bacteroidales bacterium]
MVSVDSINVEYGNFELLRDISFLINPRDRIGLTGKNGAGKTTLLKLITGLQKPTSGKITIPAGTTIGYLPQSMNVADDTTLFNETLKAFAGLKQIEKKIEDITLDIASRIDYESVSYLKQCDNLNELQEEFRIKGGNSFMAETEQALTGLGFERKEFNIATSQLSGGWRMRIELAKILLQKPGLLLLDEPTNHLDIESIEWLEMFLKSYPGAVMLVSHDRAFIDSITSRTLEISLGKVYDYKVPYSQYVKLRRERREQQMAAFRNQQKMIEDTEQFIERFRYKNTKAVQVQSRIKQLDKLDRIEVEKEDKSSIKIKFAPAPRSGTIVIEAEKLSKSYGEKSVLYNIDIIIQRGDKIAFVGKNGEGKTTFSKIIMDEIDYLGTLKRGHNLRVGYFAQNQDELLDESLSVFQTIDNVAVGEIRTKIRGILGAFLFTGDDTEKKVKVLSGGERSRLALIKLLLEPYNLLVLDEPTNHLDMQSKDILKQALLLYDGTLIVVSHDRDFLDGLVEKVYEFKGKKIKENIGGIYDFLKVKRLNSLRQLEKNSKAERQQTADKNMSETKKVYLKKKKEEKILRKLRKELLTNESDIEKLERRKEELVTILSNPAVAGEIAEDGSIYMEYKSLKEELDRKMANW